MFPANTKGKTTNNNCKLEEVSVYVCVSYRKHWEQQNGRALHNHEKCEYKKNFTTQIRFLMKA